MSLTLLDLMTEGREARDRGLDSVSITTSEWGERADRAITFLASSGQVFNSDDVRDLVGDPPHPNGMGPRFMAAVRRGQIVRVGFTQSRRLSCHAHSGPTYKGVLR